MPIALSEPVGRATRESHTAITSFNIYEVRVVATYNIVLPHYLWDLIVGPELFKYAYRTCSWFQPGYGDDEETFGSSCIYFRISSMRVRRTIADWLATSDGRLCIQLGYAASWGRSLGSTTVFRLHFSRVPGKNFDK